MDSIDDDVDMFASSSDGTSLGDPLETGFAENSGERGNASRNEKERNPVKEHLLKQFNEVEERVECTKRQIEETNSLKAKILQKFSSRAFYGESSSSGSDSDLFTAAGEPIVKRRKKTKRLKIQPLVVKSTWQHVSDDKWIVGVMLQNTSDHDLYELDLHVTIKEVEEFSGVSAFWMKDSKSFWRRTDLAKSGESCEVAATIVVDLPKFTRNSNAEIFGTVTYESDDVMLQTLIPKVTLNVDKIIGGEHDLRIFNPGDGETVTDLVQALISVKSLSIEKITDFKISHALNKDLKNILTDIGFKEILPKVFVGRSSALDRCILEVTSASVVKYRSIIYSRSIQQLNILLHLVHNALPKGTTVTCRNVTAQGVIQAFETELNLYLTTGNTFEVQEAIAKSDLMSEEFESGCTIYSGE